MRAPKTAVLIVGLALCGGWALARAAGSPRSVQPAGPPQASQQLQLSQPAQDPQPSQVSQPPQALRWLKSAISGVRLI